MTLSKFVGAAVVVTAAMVLVGRPADAADDVAAKAQVCGACHGQNGTPINGVTPIIWGQQSNYLYKELHDFHSGARVNATMSPNVKDIALPDLRSRLGAALHLTIAVPDDDMVAALIEAHAEARGLVLGDGALTYLVPRLERSFAGIEAVVAAIDRLSLERMVPPTQSVWRDALEQVQGAEQPRLL